MSLFINIFLDIQSSIKSLTTSNRIEYLFHEFAHNTRPEVVNTLAYIISICPSYNICIIVNVFKKKVFRGRTIYRRKTFGSIQMQSNSYNRSYNEIHKYTVISRPKIREDQSVTVKLINKYNTIMHNYRPFCLGLAHTK